MLRRWLSGRALLYHLLLAVLVPGCLIAGWWQLHRALGGNTLSWAYTFEWPIFAVIACIGWWQLIHEDPADVEARRQERLRRRKEVGPPTPEPIPASLLALVASDRRAGASGPEQVNTGYVPAAGPPRDAAEAVAAAAPRATGPGGPEPAEGESPALAAAEALDSYNSYLATLAAKGKAKTWRNPRGLP